MAYNITPAKKNHQGRITLLSNNQKISLLKEMTGCTCIKQKQKIGDIAGLKIKGARGWGQEETMSNKILSQRKQGFKAQQSPKSNLHLKPNAFFC